MRYIIAAILVLILASCSSSTPEEKIKLVRTMEMIAVQATSSHTFNGIARSDVSANLSFNVNGTVKKVYVHTGQKVQQGDIIAELNDSYFILKVNEVKASLKQSLAKLSNAKNNYQRIKELYVNRSSSLGDLDNARTAKDSAFAYYRSMENRLEQAKLELSYTKLLAPISGSISQVRVRRGENITSTMRAVAISSTKNIEVPISFPSALISNLRVGQMCQVEFDSVKKRTFMAKVVEVSQSSNQRTTTFPVVVRLTNTIRSIRPGMSASVSFKFENNINENSYVVPVHALMEDTVGHYLYTVVDVNNRIGRIKRLNVNRGELTTNGIIISQGVAENTLVLTAGMSRVRENQRVKVQK